MAQVQASDMWYYVRNGQRVGPVSFAQLQQLVSTGQLQPADMVLQQGTQKWVSGQSVKGLFPPSPPGGEGGVRGGESGASSQESGVNSQGKQESQTTDASSVSGFAGKVATASHPSPTGVRGPKRAAIPSIPGYEILGELGRGGMGVVYKARQVGLKRLVALKMILAGAHASQQQLDRFRSEAEAVARLQHPNIVQIYEIGEHDGLPFFSLEFVDGGCLADKIGAFGTRPREAAELMRKLALAVHAAHQRGIVHRDLKPANILLASPPSLPAGGEGTGVRGLGTPKITDFGLAKQLDSEAGQTASGAIMGTPSYMAPEQALGDIKQIGPATDVYALGVILYELLCGQTPFAGPIQIVLFNVAQTEPQSPRTLNPSVPADLETICLKCMQKKPAKRYTSAADLAEELRRYLNHEPILARPVSKTERLVRWCWRNPAVASLLAGIFLVMLAGTVVSARFAIEARRQAVVARENESRALDEKQRADREATTAQENEKKAHDEKQRADREAAAARESEKLARRHLYNAHMNLAQRAWENAETGNLVDLLDRYKPKKLDEADLRGFEWYYWNRKLNLSSSQFRAVGVQLI